MGDFFRMSQTIFLSTPFNSGWSEVTAREFMKCCLKYKDWSSKEFILFDFAILFDISVVIPIIITIIMNIRRCLQIYLNVLLWSTSFSIFGRFFICGHFIFLHNVLRWLAVDISVWFPFRWQVCNNDHITSLSFTIMTRFLAHSNWFGADTHCE